MIALRTLGALDIRDTAGQPVALAPKPLALLVYLALARPAGPQRRDRLVALFYPESDAHRGRHALRQLLTNLRATLGPELLTNGDREIAGVDRTVLSCDAWSFEQALAAGDFAAAVAAYGGPLLEGFHLAGCPDFEEWAAAERLRLRRGLIGALEQLALRASAEGRAPEAADWWRRLLAHEPYASSVTLGLMEALARAGDRAGALEAARAHAQRLREELGATPSSEVAARAEQLQARPVAHTGTTPTVAEQLASALAGRYRLEGLVAVGGMALVYKAEDLAHERPVAIKVLRPELAAVVGPDRFLQEIAITTELDHPGIVPVYDSGRADVPTVPSALGDRPSATLLYYVMPFVAGESLRARLEREGPLPLEDALRITREVAEALGHAHAHGIVHRDVKPENILLTGGHAVVADFGIARAVQQAGSGTVTAPGVALGTPAYMSPEQAGARGAVDARSDVYALGCVLYELLAGHPPFHGTTAQELLARHATDPVPSLRAARAGMPEPVEAAAYTALAKAPAERFATAAEFAAALAIDTSAYRRHRRHRRRTLLALGGAVAAALSTAAWFGQGLLRSGAEDAVSPDGARPYTIVAAFDGTADDEVRAVTMSLLKGALDESGVIAVLPDDQLRRAYRRAGKPDSVSLDVALARELALRGAIRTVVAGRIDRVGRAHHIIVRVLDADSGTVIAVGRAVAEDADAVIPALDDLARSLRATLGEKQDRIAATRRSAEAITPSFEAFRWLQRGSRWQATYEFDAARDAYARAIRIDPDFARAWLNLSATLDNMGYRDSALWAIDEALARPERLTEKHRLLSLGLRAWFLRDPVTGLRYNRRLVSEFRVGHNNLGHVLEDLGRFAEAAEAMDESERIAPFGPNPAQTRNHARWLAMAGRYDEAVARADRLPEALALRARAMIESHMGHWTVAESVATRGLTLATSNPLHRREFREALAGAMATKGRVRESREHLRANVAEYRSGMRDADVHLPLLALAVAAGFPLGPRDAGQLLTDSTSWGMTLAALWNAVTGDTAAGRRQVRAIRARRPADGAILDSTLTLTEAWITASAGGWSDAERVTARLVGQGVFSGPRINALVRWLIAEAHVQVGALDSAAAAFERIAVWSDFSAEEARTRGMTHSFAHFRLGRLYVQLANDAEARDYFTTFLETFTEPDPEYAWMVTEARARLEEMGERG